MQIDIHKGLLTHVDNLFPNKFHSEREMITMEDTFPKMHFTWESTFMLVVMFFTEQKGIIERTKQ